MVNIYHGTSINSAFSIAKYGAVLSSLDVQINKILEGAPGRFTTAELEKLILRRENASETELDRIVHVHFAVGASKFFIAHDLCSHYDNYEGGVVFGFEVNNRTEHLLPEDWQDRTIVKIPRRFPLISLNEIYLSRKSRAYSEELNEKFKEYSPKYFNL